MGKENALSLTEAGLSKSPFFSGIGLQQMTRIEGCARRVSLAAGETVFTQEDASDGLYVVESGSLEVSVCRPNGKKLSLNVMKSGDVFGEIGALDGKPRTATVAALKSSVLLKISRSDLLQTMQRHPDLAVDLMHVLCARLRWISQQVEDLGLLSIEGRMARRLMVLESKLADRSGKIRVSQSELSDFLGITRETTNKILQTWRSKGLVDMGRGSITVCDRAEIEQIAETC